MALAAPDTTMTQAGAAASDTDTHAGMRDCHTAAEAPAPADAPATPPDDDCLQRCIDLCLQHGIALVPRIAPLPAVAPVHLHVARTRAQVATVHAFPPLRPPIA